MEAYAVYAALQPALPVFHPGNFSCIGRGGILFFSPSVFFFLAYNYRVPAYYIFLVCKNLRNNPLARKIRIYGWSLQISDNRKGEHFRIFNYFAGSLVLFFFPDNCFNHGNNRRADNIFIFYAFNFGNKKIII